jgi:hypothetical protein
MDLTDADLPDDVDALKALVRAHRRRLMPTRSGSFNCRTSSAPA